VQSLGAELSGKIGFWTGNNSDGDFENLKITSKNDAALLKP